MLKHLTIIEGFTFHSGRLEIILRYELNCHEGRWVSGCSFEGKIPSDGNASVIGKVIDLLEIIVVPFVGRNRAAEEYGFAPDLKILWPIVLRLSDCIGCPIPNPVESKIHTNFDFIFVPITIRLRAAGSEICLVYVTLCCCLLQELCNSLNPISVLCVIFVVLFVVNERLRRWLPFQVIIWRKRSKPHTRMLPDQVCVLWTLGQLWQDSVEDCPTNGPESGQAAVEANVEEDDEAPRRTSSVDESFLLSIHNVFAPMLLGRFPIVHSDSFFFPSWFRDFLVLWLSIGRLRCVFGLSLYFFGGVLGHDGHRVALSCLGINVCNIGTR